MTKQLFKCLILLFLISPDRNKLSADAKIASSWFPGVQAGNFFAFSLPAFLFLPNWATISLNEGLNNARTRMRVIRPILHCKVEMLCRLFFCYNSRYKLFLFFPQLFIGSDVM